MKLAQLIFPPQSRDFRGKRWLKILLRTTHLIGIAGLAAMFLSDSGIDNWLTYLHLTIISGVAMMLLDIWANGIWLLQLRGQAIMLKLLLFAALLFSGESSELLLLSIIVISGLIAHAPGSVRYYSIFHRRRIDSLYPNKQPAEATHKCYSE
jgi:hypothetical protein